MIHVYWHTTTSERQQEMLFDTEPEAKAFAELVHGVAVDASGNLLVASAREDEEDHSQKQAIVTLPIDLINRIHELCQEALILIDCDCSTDNCAGDCTYAMALSIQGELVKYEAELKY